jgi:hypothetical protein
MNTPAGRYFSIAFTTGLLDSTIEEYILIADTIPVDPPSSWMICFATLFPELSLNALIKSDMIDPLAGFLNFALLDLPPGSAGRASITSVAILFAIPVFPLEYDNLPVDI